MTLSAATTFYGLTTIIPVVLLLTRLLGFFLGNLNVSKKEVFNYFDEMMPDISANLFTKAEALISKALFASKQMTLINLTLLIWTSLTFFNSIWSALYLMSDDDAYRSPWQYLKGIVVISVTIVLMLVAMGLPPLVEWTLKLLEHNFIVNFVNEFIPGSSKVLSMLLGKKYGVRFIIRSQVPTLLFFWLYFSFLYRWFFGWKISFKEALLGSGIFATLLLVGKNLFWIYIHYVRAGLVRNYGDYYTLIVMVMWVYFVMCFFYLGASFCQVQILRRQGKIAL